MTRWYDDLAPAGPIRHSAEQRRRIHDELARELRLRPELHERCRGIWSRHPWGAELRRQVEARMGEQWPDGGEAHEVGACGAKSRNPWLRAR